MAFTITIRFQDYLNWRHYAKLQGFNKECGYRTEIVSKMVSIPILILIMRNFRNYFWISIWLLFHYSRWNDLICLGFHKMCGAGKQMKSVDGGIFIV